ncbi:pyridoxal-phosphate dependent enzyme [Bifidobacterium longum]|uniref:pyridoxal-phosphate dependent enzyme n=1 Tax=Bifidobacterium longum TaxID=216816 RepID=UPI0024181FBC|nr:pyridoxal-phosphate dependent enzyme [Bifidobacterium longum]
MVTSAEGVAVKHPGDLPFALINEFLDDLVTVTERDINEMILLMLEKHKLVVEAAGAVSLAALEHLNLRSRKFAAATGPHVVVPIMSGGNIDTVTMGAVIPERYDRPRPHHELRRSSCRILRASSSRWPPCLPSSAANVIQLDHDQFKASGHYTNAGVSRASRSRPTPRAHRPHPRGTQGSRIPAQAHLLIPIPLAGGRAEVCSNTSRWREVAQKRRWVVNRQSSVA